MKPIVQKKDAPRVVLVAQPSTFLHEAHLIYRGLALLVLGLGAFGLKADVLMLHGSQGACAALIVGYFCQARGTHQPHFTQVGNWLFGLTDLLLGALLLYGFVG